MILQYKQNTREEKIKKKDKKIIMLNYKKTQKNG
tara:strand:- start:6949 stop:7050 length:102 start_codon:yes stop_codon:yes gene_type:complete